MGGGGYRQQGDDESHDHLDKPIDSRKDADKVPDDGWKAQLYNDSQTDQDFTASVVCR